MKKKLLIILSILTIVLVFSFARAQVSQQTIDYLLNSPQDAWVTQGLAAAGVTNLDLSYLNSFSGSNANEYAKTILAVIAAEEDPYNFNGQDLVEGLLSYHNNGQLGATNLLNDDFWGVMALVAAGEEITSEVIQDCKNFILGAQNSDGGWSYSPSGSSDTNDTAAAIMALLDAGLGSGSTEIQQALNYLEEAQNDDGGFSFYPGGESDSGSDSWVIAALYKAGIDPDNWQQNGNTPITHLESLGLPDGSYKWIASDPQGNLLMTAYAAVALSESYYPVSYYNPPPPPEPSLYNLRIEGSIETYCDDEVEATTAMEIVENGAAVCGYSYQIEQTPLGPYLVSINGEAASGTSGWLYRVNWDSPVIGASQYQLEEGDEVLWYFGEFTDLPLKLELDETQVEPEDEVTATVEYYDNGIWLPANEVTVYVGDQQYITSGSGQVTFSLTTTGNYEVFAEKPDYIRSNREDLMVGEGVSQTVDLLVNIYNPSGPGGNTISFTLNTNSLDFGTLELGQSASSSLALTNTGDLPIYVEATVSGDTVFSENLYLNQVLWEMFSSNVNTNQTQSIPVELEIPVSYTASGQKQGSLVFWATAQ